MCCFSLVTSTRLDHMYQPILQSVSFCEAIGPRADPRVGPSLRDGGPRAPKPAQRCPLPPDAAGVPDHERHRRL
eukprot:508219-Pyramimonas_sp.AAC.1